MFLASRKQFKQEILNLTELLWKRDAEISRLNIESTLRFDTALAEKKKQMDDLLEKGKKEQSDFRNEMARARSEAAIAAAEVLTDAKNSAASIKNAAETEANGYICDSQRIINQMYQDSLKKVSDIAVKLCMKDDGQSVPEFVKSVSGLNKSVPKGSFGYGTIGNTGCTTTFSC